MLTEKLWKLLRDRRLAMGLDPAGLLCPDIFAHIHSRRLTATNSASLEFSAESKYY